MAGTTNNDVTVFSGGYEMVSSGGVASGTTISGGTLEVASGGSVGGTCDLRIWTNTGTLLLDNSANFSGTVAGMIGTRHARPA